MENPWSDIFMAISQDAALMARCSECEEVKPVKVIMLLENWVFLCENCFEKNYLVRTPDSKGFDLEAMEEI